jgi:hypothetical protein
MTMEQKISHNARKEKMPLIAQTGYCQIWEFGTQRFFGGNMYDFKKSKDLLEYSVLLWDDIFVIHSVPCYIDVFYKEHCVLTDEG